MCAGRGWAHLPHSSNWRVQGVATLGFQMAGGSNWPSVSLSLPEIMFLTLKSQEDSRCPREASLQHRCFLCFSLSPLRCPSSEISLGWPISMVFWVLSELFRSLGNILEKFYHHSGLLRFSFYGPSSSRLFAWRFCQHIFLFPDQIKMNHTGPVIEAVCGGHLLWGGSMAGSQDVQISSVHVISWGEHPREVEFIATCYQLWWQYETLGQWKTK